MTAQWLLAENTAPQTDEQINITCLELLSFEIMIGFIIVLGSRYTLLISIDMI